MKYRVGDTVAFSIPTGSEGRAKGTRPGRDRFNVGLIRELLEEKEAYQIAALIGKAYIVPESAISGRAELIQSISIRSPDSF